VKIVQQRVQPDSAIVTVCAVATLGTNRADSASQVNAMLEGRRSRGA